MTEKNVVGKGNKDDEYPVFKADIEMEDDDIVFKEPSAIMAGGLNAVNPNISSINAVDKWREMSESYKAKRLEKEQVAPSRVKEEKAPHQEQPNQDTYGKDGYQADHRTRQYQPLLTDVIKRLQETHMEVDMAQVIETEPEDFELASEGVLCVGHVMKDKVLCVLNTMPIEQVASILNTRNITGIPVLEPQEEKLVGIITMAALLSPSFEKEVVKSLPDASFSGSVRSVLERPVGDFMDQEVITVTPECSLQEACQLMLKHQIQRIVVAEEQQVYGIFTASDAIRILALHRLELAVDE